MNKPFISGLLCALLGVFLLTPTPTYSDILKSPQRASEEVSDTIDGEIDTEDSRVDIHEHLNEPPAVDFVYLDKQVCVVFLPDQKVITRCYSF